MNLPQVTSPDRWQAAVDELRVREKAHTRAADALAAARRRLPMVPMPDRYTFTGANGPARLVDLFEGRRQLIVYTFMWHGAGDYCSGCSFFTDNVGHLAHLHARDTSFALVSEGPINDLLSYRERMGWDIPWYSSLGSTYHADTTGDGFALNVFLRDGEDVYRTYVTTDRGVEHLGSIWTFLDLTPLGRQETWEDTPAGRPQREPYVWWRLHDEYDSAPARRADTDGGGR